MPIRNTQSAIAAILGALLLCSNPGRSAAQSPAVRSVDERILAGYAGVYQWEANAFLYIQMWNEFTGKNQLVAFDESGEVRTLYPLDDDRFFAGPGAALPTAIESRIDFQRNSQGKLISLTWQKAGASPRAAQRVEIERREDVALSNGGIRLPGTLISPTIAGKHPAIILVHGSGAEDREYMLPFARFLIRHGVSILGYDKRGVGGSTGDWNTASFDDLAGDVVAAFEYLKTRNDIERGQIGLLGVSQAGWVMPLAAARAKDIAFLISVSGAGVSPAETTVDEAEREMAANGMRPEGIQRIVGLMRLQYEFARTGRGWDEYAVARAQLVARMGAAPRTFPGTPNDPYWQSIRRLYFYDPGPTLRQLQTPVLALFGELDDNILAEKNKNAWEAALKAGNNRDYTLRIIPKADHLQLEAKVGSNAEMASLQRFAPAYFTIIQEWLAKRTRSFRPSR
ncbi:MAG TPA: alpha/beta hydrolase [Bryobacteraceae bacterium]|nr:alpha/beta hydrolase [Bryobacteraceae bacterium]